MTQSNGTNGRKCAEEYTVQRGDSFYLISHKLGVPLRDLLAANRDIHPARLMVGDVLCIPREEDDSPNSGGLGGNTGNNGCTGNTGGNSGNGGNAGNGGGNGSNGGNGTNGGNGGVTTPEPAPNCPVEEQWIVQRGQTVADIQIRNLVSRNTLTRANPEVDLENLRVGQTLCVPPENIPCDIPSTYTLTETENLEGVAVRFNRPISEILRANPCLAPQDFEPGSTVIIPR